MNAQSCPFLSIFNTVPTLSPIAFPFGQRPLVPLQGRGVERPSLIPKPAQHPPQLLFPSASDRWLPYRGGELLAMGSNYI